MTDGSNRSASSVGVGSRPGRPRKGWWRLAAGALGLLAVAGLSWPMVWGDSEAESLALESRAEGATHEASARRVDVVRPGRGGVRRLTIQPGSIHAFESVDLFAKVSGFLKTQRVDIGSEVKRGEVLAEIDAPEREKDVDEAVAAVERDRALADLAEARVATAQAELAAAIAAVPQAEADLEQGTARRVLSEKQFDRVKNLHSRNAVDRKLVDEHQHEAEAMRAAERSARAAIASARAQVNTAEARVRQAKADLAEARAVIKGAEARLARARVLVDYTRIVAPFDGVVTQRNYFPGAFIRSAEGETNPLLTVRRTDLMRVVVQVPDLDVPLLDVGDHATVVVDALKGREFKGTVSRLGKSEEPTSRTMRVEVDLPNPSGLLVAGMYGRATIELQPLSSAPTVPAGCVVGHAERGQGAVYVVRDGKAHRVPVTLGGDDGASVEILKGLSPDDQVIVRPGGSLDDGTPVLATLLESAPKDKH